MEINELEELTRKTVIAFPKPLNLKQSDNLLNYISQNLPANINYDIKIHHDSYYDTEKKKTLKLKGRVEISGTIVNAHRRMSFDSFFTKNEEEKGHMISSINFNKTPGWTINDYRPEVVKLWDNIRNLTEKYFKEVLKIPSE